ncbi:Oligoxyloglucan reducing end-specific cellobiohydrolase [Venustampulla echinocandica]|uniref:Vacuolar protein sorting/targeting protein 10 n=1 Tax=Venustampulla echinocandica TaxID=2656787 RepID=A0A370TRZ1_9HELO|nr:Oligoxyloglucan reducing end-specific cellobiohydrolase [Venustampulla echinocandica]RDL38307.1 Oligoxyloglucan reducing end-specific cellobiohydrolase [Venustampulla echinocandica]
MRLQWRSLFVSSILCLSVSGKKDAPSVKITKFDDFIPRNLNYFDDSDVLLLEDSVDHNVYRSDDAGESWNMVEGVPKGKLYELVMHPLDNKRAYIIMEGKNHWRTSDRGTTWEKFHTDAPATMLRPRGEALVFHAGDPDRIIFNGMDCSGIFCEELAMYTTNGFSKDTKFLRSDVTNCHWAKSSPLFTTGNKDMDANRIICVAKGRFSPWPKDYRLLISDNFFASGDGLQEFEPKLEAGRTVKGIVNMAIVTKYLVVAASADGTDEMALYISDDTIRWHRAVFPHDHKLTEAAYTILESTNYSIQVDVMSGSPVNPMGVLFSSNSNGTYFQRNIEHTNRNEWGMVDFEKISGIQGIVLVNVVENFEEVEKSRKAKKIKSQISFDDGRTFQGLTCDKKDLHLHSVTDLSNSGRVFSSPAPGLVMGIGNTGDDLTSYKKGNLYVSDDAGLTWREGLKGPHKYEFGDQGSILVAIADEPTDKFQYSLNHGKDWNSVDIGEKIKPVQLTTTLDSTSLKFLLEAIEPHGKANSAGYIIAIDFDDMHEAKCTADDIEKWSARVDKDNEPTCLMGHTQSYNRRKADADCFMKNEFEDPVAETSNCECTEDDFECDYNFVRSSDRKECKLDGNLILPEGACKGGSDETFLGSSGWRLIPGNTCKRTSGAQRDDLQEHSCKNTGGEHNPSSGKIENTQKVFPGNNFKNKVYLERTDVSTGSDETVLVRTEKGVFISHDHGKNWKQIFKDKAITAIYPHQHFKDVVYFLTPTNKVYYSTERGENIRSFKAPQPPNIEGYPVMNFHWKHKDWIIWTGAKDCSSKEGCHSVASISKDRGDEWKTLQRYVRRCEFIKEDKRLYLTPPSEIGKETKDPEKLIYCEVREKEKNTKVDNPWQLVASDNFFDEEPRVHFTNVVDFATMSEFIVVATKDEAHQTLRVNASVDGTTFAAAHFPHGFEVPHQEGYTVLDSSTHSVFLHVTVNNEKSLEYGSIIKSNSNGTSYVLSLSAVDRDSVGYVDFEKTLGLEGVAMVNVVANYNSKNYAKEGKQSKTMITHNDGAEWDLLSPPKVDTDGKKFDCKGDINKCSLNIHGYTERENKAHTYSSSSATAFMFGTGSVGEYLTKDADTFMTSDGGITWKSVKKGKYMWEYGDQGSILVIVKDGGSTNIIYYSLDEGDTWEEYKFSDAEIEIKDLTTVPSDNSRNFLIWGSKNGELVTVNLDFTGLTNEQCKLDEDDVDEGDYYLWTPRHPKQDSECLFGHISQYHRKKPTSNCFNGRMIPSLHDIARNCTCTRRDFECDFNYERQQDGSCKLVPGVDPPDHALTCLADPSQIEYYSATGYRRIPTTTCQGGTEMDKSTPHPCPGHGDSFHEKHGPSGAAIFFAVVIPIVVATGVGYWVWRNWGSKFGQIRLGEQSSFNSDAPYIKYPVLVVAGVVAVVQALPLLAVSLWRSASSAIGRGSSRRFTTRDSFARGRGDYAIVDEDEGELLGDESDEEV